MIRDALLDQDPVLREIIARLVVCHQVVEKAWKALLFWHDVPLRRTHNLRELGDACVAVDGALLPLAERAEDLTQFAWLFRYPGEPELPPREEAQAALRSLVRSARRRWPACLGRCGRKHEPATQHPAGEAVLHRARPAAGFCYGTRCLIYDRASPVRLCSTRRLAPELRQPVP